MTFTTRIFGIGALLSYTSVSAANFAFAQTVDVPALNEIGLSALIAGVGIVAGWIIRNRGKKK